MVVKHLTSCTIATEYLSALRAISNRQCTSLIMPPSVWENALKVCRELGALSSAAASRGAEPSNIVLTTCMAAQRECDSGSCITRVSRVGGATRGGGGTGVSGRNDDQYPKTVRGPHCLKTEAKQRQACCLTLAFCSLEQSSFIQNDSYCLVHTYLIHCVTDSLSE